MMPVWLDEFLLQSKKLGCFRQKLLFHNFEKICDRFGRILQTRPLKFGGFANSSVFPVCCVLIPIDCAQLF
jgi:hypothetical protein